jgi:2-furoyl-CoA dehydrogenase large subunit
MVLSMEKIEGPPNRPPRWVGMSLKRKEEPRYLTGRAIFVDDIKLPQMLYASTLRSPYAHARIKHMDLTAAVKAPGVVAVIEGKEVATLTKPMSPEIPTPLTEYPIAVDKVRYQGEPVAAVAATSRALAEDAAELIDVEYESLPAVVESEKAMEKDSPILYDQLGTNLLWHTKLDYGELEEAFKEADLVVTEDLKIHRYSSTPLETHGCIASYNPADETLTIWCNQQGTAVLRIVEEALDVPPNRIKMVRMIIPNIGGGFGPKITMAKGPIILTSLLSIKAGKPVKWIETRSEHLLAGGHQCDTDLQVEAAVRNDGVFLALRLKDIVNEGASGSFGVYHTTNKLSNLQGAYRAKALGLEGYSVLTNKGPGTANRGIGKPAMCLVWERMMDIVARRLNLDPAEIRRRNFIRSDQFPFLTPNGNLIGSGDYVKVLNDALTLVGYEKLRERQKEQRKHNKYIGIGFSTSVEPGGQNLGRHYVHFPEVHASGSSAAATMKITPAGKIVVLIDIPSCGQGHETTISQIVADELGVTPDEVYVVPGFDSYANPMSGIGVNAANNFTPFVVGAVVGAARQIREKMLNIASHLLDVNTDQLVLQDGRIFSRSDQNKSKTIAEIAKIAYRHLTLLPANMEPGLHTTYFYSYPGSDVPDEKHRVRSQVSFSFGAHVAVVDVDIETGLVSLLKYIVVSDHGVIINPMIVESLIYGESLHGISTALGEGFIYNDDGQLLTSTFADYLKWSAADHMPIEAHHKTQTPDPLVALGSKVVGEGGAVLAPAAIANAVEDALADFNVKIRELPIAPDKLLSMIRAANKDDR